MDPDQNLTSQWMVDSDAFSDDPQPSNWLSNMGTAMDDFQSNRTTDQLMTNTWVSYDVSTSAAAPFFPYPSANPTGVVWPKQENDYFHNRAPQFTTRSSEVTDHMLAERKRREKLKHGFIALSAVIPGLKKTDKVTVLEDATKYVKQLQERIETLEKQTQSPTMTESVIVVKKTLLVFNDINNPAFSNETSFIGRTLPDEPLPVIEVRICDQIVLIKVHCNKKTGVAEKILTEIAKLHLIVASSNILAFGSSALDVTVLAQMNAECCIKEKELVKTLCVALKSFI